MAENEDEETAQDTEKSATQPATSAPSAATAAAAKRRGDRTTALTTAREILEDNHATKDTIRETLESVVAAFTPRTRRSTGPRQVLEKVPPEEVAAYFASTGLARKQIAAAAGVSPSVIATVQNVNGDRWSRNTFEAKRVMIDAYIEEHRAQLDAERDAQAAEDAAKTQADAAKAARKAGKSAKASKATPAAATTQQAAAA